MTKVFVKQPRIHRSGKNLFTLGKHIKTMDKANTKTKKTF